MTHEDNIKPFRSLLNGLISFHAIHSRFEGVGALRNKGGEEHHADDVVFNYKD